jgi:hypothetical protein
MICACGKCAKTTRCVVVSGWAVEIWRPKARGAAKSPSSSKVATNHNNYNSKDISEHETIVGGHTRVN